MAQNMSGIRLLSCHKQTVAHSDIPQVSQTALV